MIKDWKINNKSRIGSLKGLCEEVNK